MPRADNLLGAFIRAQRQMADLSLRELAAMAGVSNPYLSQIERGLSEPSARVLTSIARALSISAEALFGQAGLISEPHQSDDNATETALRMDSRLTESQKRALLTVCRSHLEANGYGSANGARLTRFTGLPRLGAARARRQPVLRDQLLDNMDANQGAPHHDSRPDANVYPTRPIRSHTAKVRPHRVAAATARLKRRESGKAVARRTDGDHTCRQMRPNASEVSSVPGSHSIASV